MFKLFNIKMNDLLIASTTALLLSNLLTLFLLFKKKKVTEKDPPPEFSEFLLDLMQGGALLKIQRINPENLMLRSPRSK